MILGGILILLIPMIVIGSVTFIKSSRTLKNTYEKELVQLAESLASMIRIALEKDLKILSAVASDPLIIEDALTGERNNTQKNLITLYHALATNFEALSVYDAEGIIRSNGVENSSTGKSISETTFFQTAKEGMPCIGDMVNSKTTGNPVFSLSVPIISEEGKFLGGVLGVVKADYLTPFISSTEIGTSGHIFMVDKSGRFIAHPRKKAVLNKNILTEDELKGLASKMLRQETGSIEFVFFGDEKVAGFAPIEAAKWSIAVTRDTSEIMALAYANMNFILLFSGISVLLVIPVIFFFSKTISTPVQKTLTTLNHAANQAAEGIVILDLNGEVQFANPAIAAFVGRPLQDMIGKPFQIDNATQPVDKKIRNTIENGNTWNGHISGHKESGIPFTIDLTITPLRNQAGKMNGCLAIGRDITKELLIQEQLQQSQKMEAIGTLAGGIAHDFNNILSAIFGYTALALRTVEDRNRLEGHLAQILSAAERARDLINHILTFSRKTEVEREPIIPKYIIKEALKLLRASLPSTIEIREKLNSAAVILGNPTQIHQIAMNLCANAGYEMKDGNGVLGVSLNETVLEKDFTLQHPGMQPGKYLQLEVTDSGEGIPGDIMERIFNPFFTTKPTGQGTGLGLSVVHGIVKSLEGTVTVSSKLGTGSVFTVYLPIVEAEAMQFQESLGEKLPGGVERILLVDDEEAIIRSLEALMEDLGYSVHSFSKSTLALEAFSGDPDNFDIIVTDYTMPRMTGIALARKIRGIRPDIPVIICSGYVELKEKCNDLEQIIFVKKPITAHKLSHALRQALEYSEAAPECVSSKSFTRKTG
jgi:PAS domain S-box-containing protein